MASSRLVAFPLLLTVCLATLLYYNFLPTAPPLLRSASVSAITSTGMTVRASNFTPEVLLSAPRRSAAVPNADGTFALYTVSTYSFESHKKTSEIRAINIDDGQSTLITNAEKTGEPNWLGSAKDILWTRGEDDGTTKIIVGGLEEVGKSYVAGTVQGPISDVRLENLGEDRIAIAFAAKVTSNGTLFSPENKAKKLSSGRLYDTLMVRHWDSYVAERNAIWYGVLTRGKPHITESTGRYSLSNIYNVMQGSNLESPIPPFGGSDHFDLSPDGIAFVAKDPTVNPAFNTKSDFYYVPISDFGKEPSSKPQKAQIEHLEGAASSPALSSSGGGAVFLKMKTNGYESDKNRVVVIPDLKDLSATTEILRSDDGKGLWDRSPGSVSWSNDGKSLFLQAEEHGKGLLFKLDVIAGPSDLEDLPTPISSNGYVADARPLAAASPKLFVSSNSLIDNSLYTILDPLVPTNVRQVSSNSYNGSSFSLSSDQVSEIWFTGSGDHQVHAWVVKPSDFDASKKYPLAYLIHGGPQGAWNDQWSTRWNPAVFAEQGYIVITPNPTGSTGYGQAFTDAIKENWGGLPYEDLVAGFEYIKANLSYVDTDRAVALGASYGGYMMNWMQGHELGREFKAIVCHDGVFSMTNQMSSDEQYFPNHDLGGPYWKTMDIWDRWDPSRFTGEWKTPMLVIHNELDYRLPISEGLAAFNVLQERSIPSRFLTFPDENHWVLKEENSLVWHTVVLNWINKHVGLPPYKKEEDLSLQKSSGD